MQTIAIIVSLAIAAVGIALFVRAIRGILAVVRMGQPTLGRTDNPVGRGLTLAKETLGHTRMLQWTWMGAGHWFVFVGFGLLFFTLLTAFGQLFDPHFALPLIGHFFLWEWISELFTVVMVVAIVAFIIYRATRPKERTRGAKGRFFGSTMWQAYFVESVILGVGLCILTLRGLEYALLDLDGHEYADNASALHFPFTFWLGELFSGLSVGTIENLIYFVAMLKIVISFTWMITISLNLTMGVAWHRFTAFFNIFFKREPSGRTALGAMKPLTSEGKAITLDDIDDLDEDSVLGVGKIEDFSWKGILDFTTCTECGRCQSQCPAWNTEKPLSPKLFITAMRDHAYAKAPYVQAGGEGSEAATALLENDEDLAREVNRPMVGDTGEGWFYMPEDGSAVIDPEVLWNCTSCGACVQQCPVDIEHVDHIMDMRRYQVLVEANFPAELNQLFKGLENKGNPWNMSPNARMDWAKDLPFEVPVVGETIESLDEVDWLFWVGCAGAYEDRAKKTTRAVAELLDIAGISFGVLGNGETCTGDPARRAGNEFVFQGLAMQNVETFKEYKVKKVVSTCAHCFNTLKNEYKDFGIELEVVHHTQLLNRLVREGKLTPVKEGAGAAKRSITYHDPCYLGRHNEVYTPPRELLQILPGAEVVEMERNSERSFCCGAGGARMWMEENIGERINVNRTQEAVGTGADQIAVGCPFCRVMLADGLTSEQAKGNAREEVEVLDVAQMLLASVKGESATKAAPGSAKKAAAAGATAATVAAGDEAVKDEPEVGDVTQTEDTVTETADVGPNAKASGGSSLFDTPAAEVPAPAAKQETGGSLFDTPAPAPAAKQETSGSLFDTPAPEAPAPAAKQETSGSLFDTPAPEAKAEAPKAEAPKTEVKAEAPKAEPAADLGSGGSLFDLSAPAAPAPAAATEPAAPAAEPEPEETAEAEPAAADSAPAAQAEPAPAAPASEIGSGSLFDIATPEPAPVAEQKVEAAPEAAETEPETEPEVEVAPEAAETETASEPQAGEPQAETPAPPAAAAPAAAPAQSIPDGGSLFDIVAPEPAPATASAATEAPAEAATEPVAEASTSTESPAGDRVAPAAPDGAALSAAATQAAADSDTVDSGAVEAAEAGSDASPTEETTEAPAKEPAEEPAEEKPAAPAASTPPASNGEAHQPKTDVDIHGSGSLFDL
ncbi:(Fe-S)-binding protein [Nocardioides sp. 616]|uniref:(Fe-S)-binding protein n=1 Tax=Nocardioides sp. 616 TaxID=2268090 RepID=UPI000CE3D88A|nr:(Fe-S)-binding protein [Nocardioides sp. 616]